jgi:hypothetical protein
MPIWTRNVAAASSAAVMLASLGLTGCSTTQNGVVTHNPPLSTFGGKSTARSGVQSAILVAQVAGGLALPGGPTPANIARRVLSLRPSVSGASTGACNNGTKSSQVTNGDGSVTTTTDLYYEAACATLESEEVITVVKPGATTTTGSGSVTTYDKTGTVTSYHKLTLSLAPASTGTGAEDLSISDTYAASNGGTTLGNLGADCVGTPNSPTMSCSVAQNGIASTQGFGQSFTLTGTAGTGGAKNTATITGAYFDGNGLSIAFSDPTWTVNGASQFNTFTATYSYSGTGASGSGTLTLADTVYTYTETATLSATGLTVTIVRGTDPIATATVDVAGNGTISYADGTSDVIAGGLVGA